MASKKCPKCGEDNPAEAVMCWACYTPLSGGPAIAGMSAATASLGAKGPVGKSPVGVPASDDEGVKKGIDPKIIGVGAFLFIAVIGFVLFSGALGGPPADEGLGNNTDPSTSTASPGGDMRGGGGGGGTGIAPPSFSGGSTNASSVPPVNLPFKVVTAPNPTYATGVVGILIASDKGGQAAGFARYAKDTLMKNGRWSNMQVAVFTDQATADTFKGFQQPRKGQKLGPADYASLASMGVWTSTPAFLETIGKSEKVYSPSKNPNSWWPSR